MRSPALPFARAFCHPLLWLVLLGGTSALAYLHLTQSYLLPTVVDKYLLTDFGRANEWSKTSLADFLVSIFGAFLLYLIAWFVIRRSSSESTAGPQAFTHYRERDRRRLALVLAFALLFAVILMAMYPITATDIFEYAMHSRIVTHYQQNPLAVPPLAFKGDPFLTTTNWAAHPSPYGPLWVLLTVPGSLLAGSNLILNLFWMKGMSVMFYLGCVLMVAAILRHKDVRQQAAGTLLFAWNPLILFEAPGNGHNGIMMMFFALLAIYLLVRRKWDWVIPALVGSVLVKYITAILILPFLIYCWRAQDSGRPRWKWLFKSGLVSLLFVVLAFSPFLSVPSGLLEEANFYSLLALPTVAYGVLNGIHGDKTAKVLTIAASVTAYLAVYLYSLRILGRADRPRQLILLATWLLVAYLGVACMHFQPWFVIWPVTLGIWIDHPMFRRVLLVFTASALLSYAANFFWVWNFRVWTRLQVNLVFVAVIFGPPLVTGLVSLAWSALASLRRRRMKPSVVTA